MIPSFDKIQALHKKYASTQEAYDLIFTHCCIVRDIAKDLLAQNPALPIDAELVEAGALLHDIGAYSLYEKGRLNEASYITHGIRGYELLRHEGVNECLARFASHHTGVGLTRDDIKREHLPLPDEDFLAETIEERLVMYADKFHSKYPRFNSYEAYRTAIGRFGQEKVRAFEALRAEFGVPNIEKLAKTYGHPLV